MCKIEKMMMAAVNEGRNWEGANTRVIVTRTGVFVCLYETLIYGKVRGREYYSDGGYKTATTGSRLRALGAPYSTNEKKNACKLTTQKKMVSLYYGE